MSGLEIGIFAFLFLFTIIFSLIYATLIRRRKDRFVMRTMTAYDEIPLMVGEAIEANRPIHLALGSAGIGSDQTALSLAAAEAFYYISRQASIGDSSPL